MTANPRLPVELYRPIVRDLILDKQDLSNLALTSRALSSEAYPALYDTITLKDARVTLLVLRTLNDSATLAKLVHTLILRLGMHEFEDLWFDFSGKLVGAIHKSTNLKTLCLNYLWATDHRAPTPGKRAAWTRDLNIPHIRTLRIETSTYRPFQDIFGCLPRPLPILQTLRPLHLDWLDGITHVSCERIYGHREEQLRDLRVLEVRNLESFALGDTDWAPNLETFGIVSGYVGSLSVGWESWSRPFPYLKHVKAIGPIIFWDVDRAFDWCTSQMPNLENILLLMPRRAWREFGPSTVERMATASPGLRQVSVGMAEFKDLSSTIKIVKRFTRDAKGGLSMPQPWRQRIEQVANWSETLRILLELD